VVLVWFGFLPSFTLGYYFFSFPFFSFFLALVVRFFLRACSASPRVGSGTRVGVEGGWDVACDGLCKMTERRL